MQLSRYFCYIYSTSMRINVLSKSFKKLSIPIAEITRENFPLPRLGPTLRDISRNIYEGTGVNLLRGFPIQNYAKEEQIIIFLGLNSWVGDQRLNQGTGRGICHIKVWLKTTL